MAFYLGDIFYIVCVLNFLRRFLEDHDEGFVAQIFNIYFLL